jgi:chromosomal replication initiator protein
MSVPDPKNDSWLAFHEELRKMVPKESYHTWFSSMQLLKIDSFNLVVQIPNQFHYDWIEEHYSQHITRALSNTFGQGFKLTYSILEKESPVILNLVSNKPTIAFSQKVHPDSQLVSKYSFSNFIEGECNSFAKAAALAVVEAPGKNRFNPLVVYGGVGLGKTHLIQAIGNFALQNKTARKVLYLSSDKFINDFIKSVKENRTTDFSKPYRSVDLLIVDDVQFLEGKERTQIEFFHTFNTLYQAQKQIVLSIDRPPNELAQIESRLISRFQWGLVADLQPPDFETRIAILQKKVEEDRLNINYEILEYIATHITNNIRELEGVLVTIAARSSLKGQILDLDFCKNLLKDKIREKNKAVSVEKIQETVASWANFPSDLLRGSCRKKEIARARQIAILLCSELTDLTLKSIGSHFGNRDHSTIIHDIRVAKALISSDQRLKNDYHELNNKIKKES